LDILVILGNQLFPLKHLPPPVETVVFMAEDIGLCTYEKHHQQKLVLFLAAMRAYADELEEAGYDVRYQRLEFADDRSYEQKLADCVTATGASDLRHFEIEDKPMEQRLVAFAKQYGLARAVLGSPMFTCSRDEFAEFAQGRPRLLMADFYRRQRQRLGILVDAEGKPEGGRWSFDAENRRKLPRHVSPPAVSWLAPEGHVPDVIKIVEERFSTHPGRAAEFGWPVTRKQAMRWLDDFIEQRLAEFGPYEDAISSRSMTVFHSLLTPCLNIGLLTPDEIVERVLQRADSVPLQSIEGFVRQVIGWREFVRGIYREFSEAQEQANFWSHERELTDAWYDGGTGLPPLDDAIRTARRYGWLHHIQRLMVLGNLMTLSEIRPQSAHRWFMEMFVDSSEWVMGPNVYGMGLYSDGGLFATKPYICGSNYLLKMSDYRKGPWCDVVDGLYWRFIDMHRDFFAGNPRLAIMPRALDRLGATRRESIFGAAEEFLQRATASS
jgi:deoxyribodipyrimidine photolyase-related protein